MPALLPLRPRDPLEPSLWRGLFSSTKSLHIKFFILIAVLVCAICGLALILQARTYRQYDLMLTQALNQSLAANLAAEHFAELPIESGFLSKAKAEFTKLMEINPNIEIYLLDAARRIEAFTAPRRDVVRQRIDVAPLRAFIRNDFGFPLLGDDPKDRDAKKIFSAAYVEPADPSMGFLYVILGGSEYDSVARRVQSGFLLRSVLTTVALGLIVALSVAFFVLATQTRKLRRLANAIDIFRNSDFQN